MKHEIPNDQGKMPPLPPTEDFWNHPGVWCQHFTWHKKLHMPFKDQHIDLMRDIRLVLFLILLTLIWIGCKL